MGKYTDDATKMLELIGGKENISAVTHCVTRMRFVLHDPKKADIKGIEALKSVKGSFTQAGQFQVIVGNDVGTFYNEFAAVSGIEGVSKDESKQAAKSNMNPVQRALANLAEIFAPLIPALVVGGLILGFRNLLGEVPLLDNFTKTIVSQSQFWSGVNHFLWIIGEAIFHFLPVGITWSIARKFGTTQIMGIVLGITLVSPQLLNAYGVSGGGEIPFWDFGFAQVNMIGYQAQVLPAMLAGFTLVYLEKFFKKIVPDYLSMILVPFFSLVPTVLLAHVVLGPIGWTIGNAISTVVYAGLTSAFGWLFAGLFGFLYSPLVITGLHHMTNAIDLHRGDKEEEQISIPAAISCYMGVTEPAMFGINIKYIFPFLAAMIGSAIAAIVSVTFGVMANSIGVGGLPGILSIKGPFMLIFALCMVIAVVVPFILTIIFEKRGLFKGKGVDFKIKF